MPRTAEASVTARLAEWFGRPLLPYQRDAVERISATNLAGTGYAFPSVVVVMPRQTGKTTTLWTMIAARMWMHRAYQAAYTAQTGPVVHKRFTHPNGWIDDIESSPLASRHRSIKSNGNELITNVQTSSYLQGFVPRPGKLRNASLDLVVLDECQEHSWEVGRGLDADIGPVLATRPRRQRIYCGTAAGPSWWKSKYDAARRGDMLLIEVGTWPADADPADPATWRTHHPGLAVGMTDEDHLRHELELLGPQTFAREYGNRWDDDATGDAPVPIGAWQACTPTVAGPPAAVAFDLTPDRGHASIVGVTTTGSVRLLWTGPADQLPARLRDLAGDHPVHTLPSQVGTAADLRAADLPVTALSGTDYRAACQVFHDAVVAGRVHHDHQPELLEAFGWAGRAWQGDAWVLSARASGGDITPASAAVVAWWAARTVDALY